MEERFEELLYCVDAWTLDTAIETLVEEHGKEAVLEALKQWLKKYDDIREEEGRSLDALAKTRKLMKYQNKSQEEIEAERRYKAATIPWRLASWLLNGPSFHPWTDIPAASEGGFAVCRPIGAESLSGWPPSFHTRA